MTVLKYIVRFNHLLLFVAIVCSVSDCAVYKRRYQKGYYFMGKGSAAAQKSSSHEIKDKAAALNPTMVAAKGFTEESTVINGNAGWETVCDTVYLMSGARMIVKVTKVYKNKAYYLLCESDNQAEFEIETVKLKRIAYADGKIDSLKRLPSDPDDYYHTDRWTQGSTNWKKPELEGAKNDVNLALGLVIGGLFFFPAMIAGFIIANRARKRLEGRPGYEKPYKTAQVLTGIGAGCLTVVVFFICLAIVLTLLI